AGGMAEVFKARMRGEEGFEKIVAIKRILPHMADNDDFITMFVDEAKLAAQLTHNNIIHIYDLGKVDAYHYIAMEYVDGKDLRSILKMGQERGYPLPPELALFVASKIANALDYAHRRMGMDGKELNLVHRDVSPQNILISFEGDIKLCDFGIAKAATKVSQTQTGALKGKLQYMSPEQAWGKKIDRRTDIFSLGIVLFEMLTGERLFTGDTDLTILEQVRDARVVAPSTRNADVPKKVDQIVLKALAKNAQERYQNASEMEKEINAVLYSYQPTPGPADLAIYMHRLLESQPVASDEQIDAAFAQADSGPMPVEEKKKGKGLVISKKAPSEKTGVGPAPAPAPAPAPTPSYEVSAPALSLGSEPPKSRAGLYAGIGAAVLLLGGVVYFVAKKPSGGTTSALPTPAVEQPTAAPATTAASTSTAPGPEPTKILDKAAFDAEVKRLAAEREKQLRGEAGKQPTPAPGRPGVAPTAAVAPSTVSLNPSKPIQPPKGAEPTAAPVPPTAVPRPTEAPRPTPEPVKVADASPKPIEPSAVAPNVTQPANAPVKEGDLVGPGEGVEEPKLVRLGAFSLPPQAKNLARGASIGAPMIMALITEKGAVAETRVLQASGVKFIDEAAVNALKGAKIEPATKNGVKVKMWKAFRIPIKL
ncbi:MAG TPA: protein kinase, partial [Thermoanaerobaculia bacterium]|nr:protein kinase [Thermoanaerobaculia bacterium]